MYLCLFTYEYACVSKISTLTLRRVHSPGYTDVSHKLSAAFFMVLQYCVHFTGLIDFEDGTSTLYQRASNYLPDYTTSHTKTFGCHQNCCDKFKPRIT